MHQDLFAYALSFAVIGRFWIVHHRFFGDVVGVVLAGLLLFADARRAGLARRRS